MCRFILLLLLSGVMHSSSEGQQLYFPPVNNDSWEMMDPASLGYCQDKIDSLYDMLETENSKSFLLLKDGRIVLEKYFGTFTKDSVWYWASAGKSLTAFLVGLAQQDGKLSLEDKTSDYLGKGWTSLPEAKEDLITIYHQLSMTSGLEDIGVDRDCTDPACLTYRSDAGTRWAYHNAPYTLLDLVLDYATGQNINVFTFQKLRASTGITAGFVKLGFNNVYFSRPRIMARFGLLVLNKGNWDNTIVMSDTSYYNQMVNSSQGLNQSYGYLWWLNGKSTFMVPQIPFPLQGQLVPHAPSDMIAALGRDGQILCVVPSQNLVVVRMGLAPETVPVPYLLTDKIWQYIQKLECTSSTNEMDVKSIRIVPNPSSEYFVLEGAMQNDIYRISDMNGRSVDHGTYNGSQISTGSLSPGIYMVTLVKPSGSTTLKWVKIP